MDIAGRRRGPPPFEAMKMMTEEELAACGGGGTRGSNSPGIRIRQSIITKEVTINLLSSLALSYLLLLGKGGGTPLRLDLIRCGKFRWGRRSCCCRGLGRCKQRTALQSLRVHLVAPLRSIVPPPESDGIGILLGTLNFGSECGRRMALFLLLILLLLLFPLFLFLYCRRAI
jgi:hypothetical protein